MATTMMTRPVQSRITSVEEALRDISDGMRRWRLWSALAWHYLRQRYKRTWIGLGWIAVSFAMFMVAKIFVFGAMVTESIGYYSAHLTLGYLIFRLVTNAVNGSSSVFVGSRTWISSEALPLSVYVYQLMTNNFMIFALTAIPAFGICVWSGSCHVVGLIWLLPALAIYAINTIAVGLFIGVISARYRDMMHFSSTLMQIAYFLTPVLWVPPETGPRAIAAKVNPFTHYIAILRDPVLDNTVPYQSWLIVLGCTAALILLALAFFAVSRRKIIFWL
jgi:ABC-type polysaccharide/polyol phosphate export permease